MACHQNQLLNYKIKKMNLNIKSEFYMQKSQFQFYVIGDKLQKLPFIFQRSRTKYVSFISFILVVSNLHLKYT